MIVSGVTMVATCSGAGDRVAGPSPRGAGAGRRSTGHAAPLICSLRTRFSATGLDHLLLVAVDPSSPDNQQQPHGREVGRHRPILSCLFRVRVLLPTGAYGLGRVFGHYGGETTIAAVSRASGCVECVPVELLEALKEPGRALDEARLAAAGEATGDDCHRLAL